MGAKDPLPGSIGRYKIVKRLGEGGMGSLYLAQDPEMDRLLAIKLLKEDVESDELRERFKREAKANARLNHQNIVIVYDVGEDMGRPFIAMEYIEGNTLSGVIRGREDLDLDRKLVLMEQLCDGLAYAHRAGIVHRDIKPANLMLDGRGTLKILDFGIARIGHAAATGMTQAGTLMGTLNYMSPEQMTGKPVDHRTDIFAVGAVVYEFLAYQRAFPGDIQDGVLHRIIHEPPPPLEKFVPGIDKAVVQIVAKALEKEREHRYQDLDAMRQDIARFRTRTAFEKETAAPRPVTHDAGTIVVRPSTHSGSGSGGAGSVISRPTPGPISQDPQKAERLRKRAKQIETLLDSARTALDSGDANSVFQTCEQVLMLDPDNVAAVELSEKAQSMGEQQEVKNLLADARSFLAQGDLSKASQLVGEALVKDPTNADVLAVRKQVEDAKKRKQQQEALLKEVREIVETAKRAFAQSNFEKAIQLADSALQLDSSSAPAIDVKQKATEAIEAKRAQEEDRKRQEEAARQAKLQEAERRKQEEAARAAKAKADQEAAAEARRQEEARVAKARADAEAAEAKRQEQARIAKQQDDERKRQDEERKRQDEERKRQDAERKRQDAERKKAQQEEARRAKAGQQPEPQEPGTVTLRPEMVARAVQTGVAIDVPAPAPYEIPAPAAAKKGLSPAIMGGAAAAVVIVGIGLYFMFRPTLLPPVDMTITVTPWAHLEFEGTGKIASQKAACDASPSCIVSLSPGVYNVRATNDGFKELDFDVTVEPGKPDNVLRPFDSFNPESEVDKLLNAAK